MFKDKYHLTLNQNIFLAKKTLANSIYNLAKLEGCKVTFPQTQTILDGVSVSGISIDDVEKILNLRDGWKFILKNIEQKLDIDFMCKINSFVARNESLEWGVLRNGTVGISGTDYIPKVPERAKVVKSLRGCSKSPREIYVEFLRWFGNGGAYVLFIRCTPPFPNRLELLVSLVLLFEHAL